MNKTNKITVVWFTSDTVLESKAIVRNYQWNMTKKNQLNVLQAQQQQQFLFKDVKNWEMLFQSYCSTQRCFRKILNPVDNFLLKAKCAFKFISSRTPNWKKNKLGIYLIVRKKTRIHASFTSNKGLDQFVKPGHVHLNLFAYNLIQVSCKHIIEPHVCYVRMFR